MIYLHAVRKLFGFYVDCSQPTGILVDGANMKVRLGRQVNFVYDFT